MMTDQTARPNKPVTEFGPTYPGKDEMNLAEFPVVKLGSRDKREVIVYEAWAQDDNGERSLRKWEVRGAAGLGLPDEFGDRVLVGLMALTAEQGFHSRKVIFSEYQLLKVLGLTDGKCNYQALEKVLKQLVGVTIYSQRAFWDNAKKRRITSQEAFHIVERFWLRKWEEDVEKQNAESAQGYIIWSETFWQSFQAGYIKNLDLPFYLSLDNAIARRLYRFLDKWMHYRNECEIDIFDLVSRLGMVRYAYPSEATKKLKPAFDELIRKGFLSKAEICKRGKFTRVRFIRVTDAELRQIPLRQTQVGTEAQPPTPSSVTNVTDVDMVLDVVATISVSDVIETDLASREGAREDFTSTEDETSNEAPLIALYARYSTSEILKQTWQDILREFAQTMPADTYRMLADSALVDVKGEEAVIAINERNKDWIERQMRRKFLSRLTLFLGTPVRKLTIVPLL